MTAKELKQTIRAEIERRISAICTTDGYVSIEKEQEYEILRDFEDFIDSLPDATSSDDCDGLEEEYETYVDDDPVFSKLVNRNAGMNIVRHFAEWQKKQDQKTIELAEDHAMLAGMNKMEEQMMKGAVEAEEVGRNVTNCPIYLAKIPVDTTKHGDKVKLIIIPQDDNE